MIIHAYIIYIHGIVVILETKSQIVVVFIGVGTFWDRANIVLVIIVMLVMKIRMTMMIRVGSVLPIKGLSIMRCQVRVVIRIVGLKKKDFFQNVPK